MATSIISSKYIYLDWNVIKYMKQPRNGNEETDLQFKNTILKLKKKYAFPFSEAHIEDRLNNYSPEYDTQIMEDIMFAISINDNKALGFTDTNDLIICEHNMIEAFNDIKNKKMQSKNVSINSYFPLSFKVDISKIPQNHPMYDLFLANGGEISPTIMDDFLLHLYQTIFVDVEKYKNFRRYIGTADIKSDITNNLYSLNEVTYLNSLLFHILPFLESFNYDKNQLLNDWKNISERYLNFYSTEKTLNNMILLSYTLLDIHPLFNEKLKKGKNTLDNIRRDGKHCMFASKAEHFVSEDAKTREKSDFIYKAFNVKTKVLSVTEFLDRFLAI